MNIILLANRDLAANYALNLLLPRLAGHRLSLYLSSRVGSAKSAVAEPLSKMAALERTLLERLENTDDNWRSFEQLCALLDKSPQMLDNINTPEGIETIAREKPDLILSIRFGKILKDPVIALPRYGVLNLHSGLLPQYRGVMATFWAMFHGEKHIGTTLHYVPDSGIDTGDIVAQTQLAVDTDKSYQWHVMQLYKDGCQAMAEAVTALDRHGRLKTLVQDGEAGYFTYPTADDLTAFAERGLKLSDSAELSEIFS